MSAGRNDSQRIWASQSVASCALCETHRRHTSVSIARWVGARMPDVCWRMLTYADVCKTHRRRHTSVSIARWVGARIKLILNVNGMIQLARSLIHEYATLVPVCPSLSDRWVFSYRLYMIYMIWYIWLYDIYHDIYIYIYVYIYIYIYYGHLSGYVYPFLYFPTSIPNSSSHTS
jgi:hypothetical protein